MTPRSLPSWLVNGLAVTSGLALVQASAHFLAGPGAAEAAIAAAVCTSLADVVTTTGRVARRVLAALLAGTLATALFLAVTPLGAPAGTVMAGLVVFASMLLMSWGPKAASVAFAADLSLVFAMSLPATQPVEWSRVGWALAGSLGYLAWAVATGFVLQRTWHRQALSGAADGLATLFRALGRQLEAPEDASRQAPVAEAEAALAERMQAARDFVFDQPDGLESNREIATLLHLLDLRDLAVASNLDAALLHVRPVSAERTALVARVMGGIGEVLDAIARHVRTGRTQATRLADPTALERLQAELAALPPPVLGLSDLLVRKLGLLRELQALLASTTPVAPACRREDLRRYVSPDEWSPAAVRANLRAGAPVFRHALRTGATAMAAFAVSRGLPWVAHPQWVLLTVVAVMQGSLAQTLLRRDARVAGTLVGCVVATVLLAFPSKAFVTLAFLVAAGVAHAFFGVRYAVTAGAAAVMAITQAHLAEGAGGLGSLERLADTLTGAAFGWLALYLLPTWERSQLPRTLDAARSALADYAQVAMRPDGLPRFSRERAYDAVRAVSAARLRSLREPAEVRVPAEALAGWLASAYGLLSQLSNLRLTLTLHAAVANEAAVALALGAALRETKEALEGRPVEPSAPAWEAPLARVPELLPRVHRTLDVARLLARRTLPLR